MGSVISLIISAVGVLIAMRGCVDKDILSATERVKASAEQQKDYDKVVKYLHSTSIDEKNIVERKTSSGELSWFLYDPINKTKGQEITADGRQFRIRVMRLNQAREWREDANTTAHSTLVWKKIQGMDPALQGL